jgi:hypothetical protein
MWHGSMINLQKNINNLSSRFPDQQVWLLETAYYDEGGCDKDDIKCQHLSPYTLTEQGQYNFLQRSETCYYKRIAVPYFTGEVTGLSLMHGFVPRKPGQMRNVEHCLILRGKHSAGSRHSSMRIEAKK